MANLSLSPTWESNIYQLETTDPVQGGASGISNLQPKQLGNRTQWLKEKVDSVLAGNFKFRNVNSYSTSQTLTIDDNGALVVVTGSTAVFLTLPDVTDADVLEEQQAIVFKNNNTATQIVINTFSGDGTAFDNGNTFFSLKTGDVLMVVRKGMTYYTIYVRERGVPAGTVNAYAATTGVPDGWLYCNGAIVSRASYPQLFAAIGTTYNTGGETGTQFRVPDLRGEFIRGLDLGRGVDSGRTLGSAQSDAFKSHTHGINNTPVQSGTGTTVDIGDTGAATTNVTKATGGTETRPRNVAMIYIIKI